MWDAVRTFNRACGVRLRGVPGWVPADEVELALRLIDEELGELGSAIDSRDLVETADAIADSLVVLAGMALRLGVARTFLPSFLHNPPGHATWALFDAADGDGWMDQLDELNARLHAAVHDEDLIETDNVLHLTMFVLSDLALQLRIPLAAVFEEVNASNMSKLVDGKVMRRQDGKILKGPNFRRPNLAEVLAAHGWAEAA
jgi:predicted HAD superfamily Cof-like phosphohydrolase